MFEDIQVGDLVRRRRNADKRLWLVLEKKTDRVHYMGSIFDSNKYVISCGTNKDTVHPRWLEKVSNVERTTLRPGDLVCYNVGSAKETSLAHVVEVRHPRRFGMDLEERIGSIFVLWIKVGEYKPRSWDGVVKPGQVVKHPYNSAFEKVPE